MYKHTQTFCTHIQRADMHLQISIQSNIPLHHTHWYSHACWMWVCSLSLTTHSALPEAHRGPALLLILKARFTWCHCFGFWLVNRDMTSETQKTKGTEISCHVQRQMTWILQVNSLFLQPPTSYTQLGHTNTTKQRQKGKQNQFYHVHDRFVYFNISALLGHGPSMGPREPRQQGPWVGLATVIRAICSFNYWQKVVSMSLLYLPQMKLFHEQANTNQQQQ